MMGKNMSATMCTECGEGLCYYGSTICPDCFDSPIYSDHIGMFIFVKKVNLGWKVAVGTLEDVEKNRIDWSDDKLEMPTFWTKNAAEALIVAARMYHKMKDDGIQGIIPLDEGRK